MPRPPATAAPLMQATTGFPKRLMSRSRPEYPSRPSCAASAAPADGFGATGMELPQTLYMIHRENQLNPSRLGFPKSFRTCPKRPIQPTVLV